MFWSALLSWDFEPVPVLATATAALLYWRGRRLPEAKRSPRWDRGDRYFCIGLALLIVALCSPIDNFASQLQWDHMVQHVILLVAAPPLILLSDAFAVAWRGIAAAPRPQLITNFGVGFARSLHTRRGAIGVVVLFTAVLFVWHYPGLYNLTLRVEWVHNLEHTLFLIVGLLFWDQVISSTTAQERLGLGGRAAVLIAGMLAGWVLAVLIGYAPRPLYAYSGNGVLSALADQQIAAGVMWVPASIPFIAGLVYLCAAWFELDDRAATAETGPITT